MLPDSSVCWWAADVCRRPSSPHQERGRLWRWWWWRTTPNRWTEAAQIQSTCPGCGGMAWRGWKRHSGYIKQHKNGKYHFYAFYQWKHESRSDSNTLAILILELNEAISFRPGAPLNYRGGQPSSAIFTLNPGVSGCLTRALWKILLFHRI